MNEIKEKTFLKRYFGSSTAKGYQALALIQMVLLLLYLSFSFLRGTLSLKAVAIFWHNGIKSIFITYAALLLISPGFLYYRSISQFCGDHPFSRRFLFLLGFSDFVASLYLLSLEETPMLPMWVRRCYFFKGLGMLLCGAFRVYENKISSTFLFEKEKLRGWPLFSKIVHLTSVAISFLLLHILLSTYRKSYVPLVAPLIMVFLFLFSRRKLILVERINDSDYEKRILKYCYLSFGTELGFLLPATLSSWWVDYALFQG